VPAGTNIIEVHQGELRLRCIACGTTRKAPTETRITKANDLCHWGCYEILSDHGGIYWNGREQRYHVADATLDRLAEAAKLALLCSWRWPEGRTHLLSELEIK
jgi:hypothetical protein